MKRRNIIIIAAALLVLISIAGLSAYLTDSDFMKFEYLTLSPGDFSVSVDVSSYVPETTILPGQEVSFNPTVKNSGTENIFGFLELYIPVYSEDNLEAYRYTFVQGDNNSYWYQVSGSELVEVDGVTYSRTAYAYTFSDGTTMKAINPDESADPIFTGLQLALLDDETYQTVSKDVIVYAYAIQTYGFGEPWIIDGINELNLTPEEIWALVEA